MNAHKAITFGALLMAMAVGLGAFGAHGLDELLTRLDSKATWETAVRYQAWHALGLILLGVLTLAPEREHAGRITGWMLTLGSLLFSGSLFVLSVEPGMTWLGPITPLGGLLLIASWIGLARLPRSSQSGA